MNNEEDDDESDEEQTGKCSRRSRSIKENTDHQIITRIKIVTLLELINDIDL